MMYSAALRSPGRTSSVALYPERRNSPPENYRTIPPVSREVERHYSIELLNSIYEKITREAFEARVRELIDGTKHVSSLSQITSHPKFIEIVGMGDPGLRLILGEIQNGNIYLHWFPALKRIAQTDPVAPQHRGFIQEMARAWIQWGRQSGKL